MDPKHLLIGITGGSGSGKTSFIKSLKGHFTSDQVCVISQDDYYHPREMQQLDITGVKNFDRPESIDKKAFRKDIQLLMAGMSVTRQEYTFNNELSQPGLITLFPAPVIIVEGLFVLHFKKIRQLLDLRVYLHAKENLKVIRRIKRDREERNYPLEDVLYRYEHHVLPTYEKYIQPHIESCDLIINNNQHFSKGLQVLAGYISDWLKQNSCNDTGNHARIHQNI